MTDAYAPASPAPTSSAQSLDAGLAAQAEIFKAALPVQTAGDVEQVLDDGAAAVRKTVDADVSAQAVKIPVLGPIAAAIFEKAIDASLKTATDELQAFVAYHLSNSATA